MRASRIALTLAAVFALTAELSAHRLDEYLQASRIGVEPDRVDLELSLTPGIAVADRIVAEIDRDRDGLLSAAERDAYVAAVLRDIELTIGGEPLATRLVTATFPDVQSLDRGDGSIQLLVRASMPSLAAGVHQLGFRNAHHRDVSVYLANALVPESDRVAVRAQHRDEAQHELIIEYVLHAGAPSLAFVWLMSAAAVVMAVFTGLRCRCRRAAAGVSGARTLRGGVEAVIP